jgi:SAM-dependent methyltransferase
LNFYKITPQGDVLDAEGHVLKNIEAQKTVLKSIRLESNQYLTDKNEIVEPFDFIFLISKIDSLDKDKIIASAQFDISLELNPNKIYLSYKDQFIIYTMSGVPALLSEQAQDQLFDLADEFSDDEIIFNSKTYSTYAWMRQDAGISDPDFWSTRYQDKSTPWDLHEPSPALVWALQKFKLPKLRVAVLGCGRGHDAFHFASQGHKTTGFDFSPSALAEAEKLYGQNENLKWVQQDVFNLNADYFEQFDLVFDHTLFCAVDPDKRQSLVKIWERLLTEQGQILGVFFTMPKLDGPPYGSTEGEIGHRLSAYFRTDFWMRSRVSAPSRMGKELIVLATKV